MRPTIAIIDSDKSTRATLLSLLTALDVDVCDYDNAESYLQQSATSNHHSTPACLIADMNLRGMSGMQLLKKVRSTDRAIPVVLVGSESDVPMAVEAMRQGATDFVEKSQLDVTLLRRVSALLRHQIIESNKAANE